MTVRAVGTPSADQPLRPMDISRRDAGPHDVRIEILFCGICHSDLHQARSEWKRYQAAPGPRISTKAFWLDRRYPLVNRWRDKL